MPNSLPDLDALPTLQEDSERLDNLYDAIASAKERRAALEERAEELEEALPEMDDEIEELRVRVATGDASKSSSLRP